eukprot:5560480-Prorocentrum_lima.AAC.1
MTSSLVGSEMCIRDRAMSLPDLSPGQRPGRLALTSTIQKGRGPGGACLLYTSDAADECRSRWS